MALLLNKKFATKSNQANSKINLFANSSSTKTQILQHTTNGERFPFSTATLSVHGLSFHFKSAKMAQSTSLPVILKTVNALTLRNTSNNESLESKDLCE